MSNYMNVLADAPDHAADVLGRLDLMRAKLDRMAAAVEQLDRRREEIEDLLSDTMPAVNGAITLAIARLAELEKSDTPARLLRVANTLAAPDVTALAERAVAALTGARRGKPPTLLQLFRARKEPRVRRGLAALIDVLRIVGEGGHAETPRHPAGTTAPPATSSGATHCAVPAPPAVAVTSRPIAGKVLRVDGEGFLVDRDAWSRDIATALAAEAGLAPLTAQHWQVIDFCRKDAADTGASPGMRRITQALGIAPREMYALFPKGPGILAARVAGLSKPRSCV